VKVTKVAFDKLEEEIYRSLPTKYATSFWASNFPIYNKSCNRQALYNLMNIPRAKGMDMKGRSIVEMGKAAEYLIVHRWAKAGYTIGGSVPLHYGGDIKQLALEDFNTWLSGNLDAVLDLRPRFNSVLPVDIKSKNDESIRKMRVGALSYNPKHYAQIQAYIYLCNLYHEEMGWAAMGLEPANSASLFYVSRENPSFAFEYHLKANWPLINFAIERLKEWKQHFISDTLPPRDKSWQWSKDSCQYCEMKKFACKPDNKNDIQKLSDSNGVAFAESLLEYSFSEIKEKVLSRWA